MTFACDDSYAFLPASFCCQTIFFASCYGTILCCWSSSCCGSKAVGISKAVGMHSHPTTVCSVQQHARSRQYAQAHQHNPYILPAGF